MMGLPARLRRSRWCCSACSACRCCGGCCGWCRRARAAINFPPTRLLFDIAPKEETPSRTPWWLTLLRLTLAALVIFAAAGPLWNPPVATSAGAAPIALLIDDGWAAAATWDARVRTADDIIARAEADETRRRHCAAVGAGPRYFPRHARRRTRARAARSKPKPHAVERCEALPALARFLTARADRPN